MRSIFFLAIAIMALFLGCGSEEQHRLKDNNTKSNYNNQKSDKTTLAFFGDKKNDRVIIVDIDNMKTLNSTDTYTHHKNTYTVADLKILPKLYISNRGSNAVDVMDANSHKIIKTIKLRHHPRSADALNTDLGLVAVSGMDKPMISIIDIFSDKVVAVAGDDIVTAPVNSPHGTHACGHPYWLDKNHFVLIDRARKRLITYKIEKNSNGKYNVTMLNKKPTYTSAHQIVPKTGYNGYANRFYLINEGSKDFYPTVVELLFDKKHGLKFNRQVVLKSLRASKDEMGAHHGDFLPDSAYLYVGSKNRELFIINYKTMKVEHILEAGFGAGHTMMVPQKNLAIVINHKDKFITIIDTISSKVIKDIEISNLPDSDVDRVTIQSHPSYYISKDSRYFYIFLTEEARLVKVNLDRLEVADSLYVGGKPAMGTFRESDI